MTTSLDYADKVAKLLNLAERASTPEEAEAATSKAQQIMDMHMIDLSMLPKGTTSDDLAQLEIAYTGIFGTVKREIGIAVARSCGCKIVITEYKHRKPVQFVVRLHGFQSDLDRAKLLDASLQIQCMRALKAWEKKQKETDWIDLPGFEQFKDRRSFVSSFATGVRVQLDAALYAAKQEAANERAQKFGEAVSDASAGVEVALRDRSDSVRDWFDSLYGDSLRSSTARRAAGSYGAQDAGFTAGRAADTNKPRVGGGRIALDK